MKTITLAFAAATMLASAGTPALADPPRHHDRHYRDHHDDRRYYRTDNGIRYWRGDDGRYRCRRSDGTTGLIVGGAVGALAGRAVDTHGDRTLGTVLGAAGGALLGREVDRGRKISCR